MYPVNHPFIKPLMNKQSSDGASMKGHNFIGPRWQRSTHGEPMPDIAPKPPECGPGQRE